MENDVQSAIGKLEMISRNFPIVLNIATQFAKKARSELASFDTDVAVEESLPSKAMKRKFKNAVAAEQGGLNFSGKILIIKEKFRVFLENFGIRGKISNILFRERMSGKFFCYMSGKHFSAPFLYMCGKIFWFMSEKKVATGGGGGGEGKF